MTRPPINRLRSSALATLLALLALGAGAPVHASPLVADEVARTLQTERATQPPLVPDRRADQPLSDEDAALVRELALLEKVELLKNLELFEPARREPRRKKGAP